MTLTEAAAIDLGRAALALLDVAGQVRLRKRIADQISEYVSESAQYWGVQFPRCPGHVHAAWYGGSDDVLTLECPETGAEIRRVTV